MEEKLKLLMNNADFCLCWRVLDCDQRFWESDIELR